MFSINSNSSSAGLRFSAAGRDFFTVEVSGTELGASRKVYAYSPHGPTIGAWFARLGGHRLPWEDVERWESLEGEFALAVTCSTLGVVTFALTMSSRFDAPEPWSMSAAVDADLGQLPGIAARAAEFFAAVGDPSQRVESGRRWTFQRGNWDSPTGQSTDRTHHAQTRRYSPIRRALGETAGGRSPG